MNTKRTKSRGRFRQGRLSDSHRPTFMPRMAPMIDVIFLLLIFFVLTARFRTPEQFLPFKLSQADATMPSRGLIEPLVVRLSPVAEGCRVTAGSGPQAVDLTLDAVAGPEQLADLAVRTGTLLESQNRTLTDPISLECDDGVTWDHLVKVYNVLYAMGIHDITFPMEL